MTGPRKCAHTVGMTNTTTTAPADTDIDRIIARAKRQRLVERKLARAETLMLAYELAKARGQHRQAATLWKKANTARRMAGRYIV